MTRTRTGVTRLLVVLVVIVSLPLGWVVLPASPAVAIPTNTTEYGQEKSSFQSDPGGAIDVPWIDINPRCNGSAYWVVTNFNDLERLHFGYSASCSGIRAGLPTIGGNDFSDVTVTGINDAGAACTLERSSGVVAPGSGISTSFTEKGQAVAGLLPDGPVCTPTRIESGGRYGSWRANITMPARPDSGEASHSTSCAAGGPQSYEVKTEVLGAAGTNQRFETWLEVRFKEGTTGYWGYTGYVPRFISANTVVSPKVGDLTASPLEAHKAGANVWRVMLYAHYRDDQYKYPPVTGVQLYYKNAGATLSTPSAPPGQTQRNTYSNAAPGAPSTSTGAYVFKPGTTDPARCVFYLGEQLVDVSGATWDDPYALGGNTSPAAPVDDAVTPGAPADPRSPDEGCGFELSDPGSWASAGMCALVGLIGNVIDLLVQLLAAVSDLAGAIGRAISDLFMTLFVPDPSTWGFSELSTTFQTRPPGSLLTGTGAAVQSTFTGYQNASCGSIVSRALPIGQVDITCQEIKSTAGWDKAYGGMQAALILMTGWWLLMLVRGTVRRGEG